MFLFVLRLLFYIQQLLFRPHAFHMAGLPEEHVPNMSEDMLMHDYGGDPPDFVATTNGNSFNLNPPSVQPCADYYNYVQAGTSNDDTMREDDEDEEDSPKRDRIGSKDFRCKQLAAATDMGVPGVVEHLLEWSAEDDVALLTAAAHVCDLLAVASHRIFSRRYSLNEVEERWYELMYNESLSKQAKKRISELSADVILRIQSHTVFSLAEEELLTTISETPKMEELEELLKGNSNVFHHARTPQVLAHHWAKLKQCGLVKEEYSRPMVAPLEQVRCEREALLATDSPLQESRLERVIREGTNTLALPLTGVSADKLDKGVVALLRGRVVKFLIRTDCVIIGRETPLTRVDINLSLEGPALKVSRRQAELRREPATNQFTITNLARRAMYVDGKTLIMGNSAPLHSNSTIQVAHIRLVFRSQPS